MFKLATDSERKCRGTGYGKTVRPGLRGGRRSNPLSYLDKTEHTHPKNGLAKV